MSEAETKAGLMIKELNSLREDMVDVLAKLVVAQNLDRNITDDDFIDYCLDWAPNAEKLAEEVNDIRSNPKHYMHPSKLK